MSNRKKILLSGIIFLIISVFIVFVVTEINREKKQITNNQKTLLFGNSQKDIKKDDEFINQDNFMGVKKYLTYQNNKYGIEFQYPISWSTDMMITRLIPNSSKDCEGNDCQKSILISVVKNEEKLTVKQYLDKNINIDKNTKEIKIGDTVGYKATEINSADSSENVIFVALVNDNNFFKLQGQYLTEEDEKIFDEIISSFKFAESNK